MATITINGNTYTGRNVSVINGRVTVDGKDMTPDNKTITISVQGDINELHVDACSFIKVKGNCKSVNSGSGDIACNDVLGSIKTGSGDVSCKNVQGNVRTGSGDVECGNVAGNVTSMSGDIEHR